MNENLVTPAADISDEQAQVEIERIKIEIQRLLDQMKRDREAAPILAAHTEATMQRVREGLDRILAR